MPVPTPSLVEIDHAFSSSPGILLPPAVPPLPSTSSLVLDPTTTIIPLDDCAAAERVNPSMNDDLAMVEETDEVEQTEERMVDERHVPRSPPCSQLGVIPSPRQQRRAQAQPIRLDTTLPVCCYRYAQGRPAMEAGDARWQGRVAHLHYFLPENWSPSYKFTVFEDSYVLSFAHAAGDPWPPAAFHLARPLHGPRVSSGAPESSPAFELVWPIELDRSLLEMVEAACDRVVPGVKRKPGGLAQPLSLHSVHAKLQRLQM